MLRNTSDAVNEICLSFPETETVDSHSMANFRVRGKTFAIYAINHHGDGRVALWLEAQTGSQPLYVEMEPEHYFIPGYLGHKGWLGVHLNTGLSWPAVVSRVREAFQKVAPSALVESLGGPIRVKTPVAQLTAEQFDPLQNPRAQQVLEKLGGLCASYPETSQATQFGNPVWKAGKKTFVCAHRYKQRLCLQVWVGVDQQSLLTLDPRYQIPAYVGHNGWIDLDVEENLNWEEVQQLLLNSYRHFALKRMLKLLD